MSKLKRELDILGPFHGFGTLLDTSLGVMALNFYVLLSRLNLIIVILQMRKLRLREIKSLLQGHPAPWEGMGVLNPSLYFKMWLFL